MSKINNESFKQLFTEARTFTSWQSKDVDESTLHEIYDLMKWGPTSANSCPVRLVFVKSIAEKEKLVTCVAPANVEKTRAAPVSVIVAMDEKFYEKLNVLAPHNSSYFIEMFSSNAQFAAETALRNSSLQGAYFILAARAVGLDCGPMSGFDNKKVDELFFAGTSYKSNFLCNIGYGDRKNLHPRAPRLAFEEACKVI
jgi:3-hydroxypropanoate dehydrogenase